MEFGLKVYNACGVPVGVTDNGGLEGAFFFKFGQSLRV